MVHVPRWCNSISISEAELKSNSQHFFNENGNLVISQMVKCFLIGKGEVHRNAAIFLWHEAQSEATLLNFPVNNNKKNPQSKTSRVQLLLSRGHVLHSRYVQDDSSQKGKKTECATLEHGAPH